MRDVLEDIVRWSEGEDAVRAVVLVGSRAEPGRVVDGLSDFDVVLVVDGPERLAAPDEWIRTLGSVLVSLEERYELAGRSVATRLVQYADGVRIDFTLCPTSVVETLVADRRLPDLLDAGYRTLVDKDDLLSGLPDPSGERRAHQGPTEAGYRAVVNEFWWEATCAAKNLARRELFTARYNVDRVMRHQLLRPMLAWYADSLDGGGSVGPYGRGVADALPAADSRTLERTWAGPTIEANWNALFAMLELFERAAGRVAVEHGFEYPDALGEGVRKHLIRLRLLHTGD